MAKGLKFKLVGDDYAVSRLGPTDAVPEWADGPGFSTVSRTEDELSIVCRQERVPEGVRCDREWSCFKLQGPFAFGETGIVFSAIQPLSRNGIGVFVISTFDGDHLLVKSVDKERAKWALTDAGHVIL